MLVRRRPEDRTASAALALAPVLLAGVALLRRTRRQVRRLTQRGARVAPLAHDLHLPSIGENAPSAVRRVVVLGDSAAAGHGLADVEHGLARRIGRALHAGDGRETVVDSVAVDGATTAQVLATQLPAARGAQVVVVGVGVNDAIHLRCTRRVRRELGDLLGLLRGLAPGAGIVLICCPDLSVAPGLPGLVRPPLGWRCRRVARAQAALAVAMGVPHLDLPRTSLPPEVFGPDGFHPGALGHARMAEQVLARLAG